MQKYTNLVQKYDSHLCTLDVEVRVLKRKTDFKTVIPLLHIS